MSAWCRRAPVLALVVLASTGSLASASSAKEDASKRPWWRGTILVDGRLDRTSLDLGGGGGVSYLGAIDERSQVLGGFSRRSLGGAGWQYGTLSGSLRLHPDWFGSVELNFGSGRVDDATSTSERAFGYHTQRVQVGFVLPERTAVITGSLQHIDIDRVAGLVYQGGIELATRPDLSFTFRYGAAFGERLGGQFVLVQGRYGRVPRFHFGVALGNNGNLGETGSAIVLSDTIPAFQSYGGVTVPYRGGELSALFEVQSVSGSYRQAVLLSWKIPL